MLAELRQPSHEYYIAVLNDRASEGVVLVASNQGGMNIEEVAAKDPAGRRDATWASLELIQRRKTAGDLDGAAQALARAADADVVDVDRLTTLARELADRAGRPRRPRASCQVACWRHEACGRGRGRR